MIRDHSQASSLARPSDLSGHELPTVWGVYGLARGRSEGCGASASGPRLCAMLRHQRIANLYAWRIFLRRARRTRVRRCCARSHAVLAQAPPAVRVGRHPPAGLLHPEVVVPAQCRMPSRSGVCGETRAGGRAPAANAAPGATPCARPAARVRVVGHGGAGAPSIVHRCDARSFAFGNLRGKRARKSAYSVRFFPDTAASTIKLSLGWK